MIALHSLPTFMRLFTGRNGVMKQSGLVCLSLSFFMSLVSRSFGDILSLSSLSIHCLSVKRLGVLCNVTVSLKDKTESDMNLLTYSSSPASLRPLSPLINPQPLASLSTVLSVKKNSALFQVQKPANSQNYTCGDFCFN